MAVYHKSLVNRFSTFQRDTQLMMVGNELNRAELRSGNANQKLLHLGLALELIDLAIADRSKWSGRYKELCRAREMISRVWAGVDSDIKIIVRNLLKMSPATAELVGK